MSRFALAFSGDAPSNLVGQSEGGSRESQVLLPNSVRPGTAGRQRWIWTMAERWTCRKEGWIWTMERRVCSEEGWTLCLGSGCKPWDHV